MYLSHDIPLIWPIEPEKYGIEIYTVHEISAKQHTLGDKDFGCCWKVLP
jgi:hypothetical protein